ncbi:MAG: hypothetical protein GDA50_01720 [Alphaproteobacteria bacterium GM202ARS2]|nr:hypothetical protein [Alphaproteobacteria bacterium GM202ARS2]
MSPAATPPRSTTSTRRQKRHAPRHGHWGAITLVIILVVGIFLPTGGDLQKEIHSRIDATLGHETIQAFVTPLSNAFTTATPSTDSAPVAASPQPQQNDSEPVSMMRMTTKHSKRTILISSRLFAKSRHALKKNISYITTTYESFYASTDSIAPPDPTNLMHFQAIDSTQFEDWQQGGIVDNGILNLALPATDPQQDEETLRFSLRGDNVRNIDKDITLEKSLGALLAIESDF